jgi:hypothetical protein
LVGAESARTDQASNRSLKGKSKTPKLEARGSLPLVGTDRVQIGQVSNRSLKGKTKMLRVEAACGLPLVGTDPLKASIWQPLEWPKGVHKKGTF